MRRRPFTLAVAGAALAGWRPSAFAQTWPDRPVKLILAHPAGSGVDNVARVVADRVSRGWGQQVVIENKPGGQNLIGAQYAARSPADGYNFYFATSAALVTNVYLFKALPYDPQKDFVPVGLIGRSPFAILVEDKSPLRSIADLLSRARAQPGRVSIAIEGPKTFGGMIARVFNAQAKVDTNLVSYASVAIAMQDTLGGHTDVLVADVASTAQLVRQGRLRMLAVTTGKRLVDFDTVPALAETLPGFEMSGWMAVVAPAGTPREALQRFARDLDAALLDKDTAERIRGLGPVPEAGGAEYLAAFLLAERVRWEHLTKEIGLLPE
jgi:tripartite-type tricarboxylate transporter receptor subunit TctC